MMKKIMAVLLALTLAMPTTISTAHAEDTTTEGTTQCQHTIDTSEQNAYVAVNDSAHYHTGTCASCGASDVYVKEAHTFSNKTDVYTAVDATYHTRIRKCSYCKRKVSVKEKHSAFAWFKNSDGVYCYGCPVCKYEVFSAALKYTVAYKDSTSIKVVLTGKMCKGDKIKVVIGKNTYTKTATVATTNQTYKLKIKEPKKNYKIVVYIGHKVGSKYEWIKNNYKYEYVMTSANPKKGMTRTQVLKYTSWGSPSKKKNGSKGLVYWYYSDGSKITFKNSKVYKWSA